MMIARKSKDLCLEHVEGVMIFDDDITVLTTNRVNTLEDALKIPDRKDEANLMVAGLIDSVLLLHSKGFVHRNLKP